MQKLFDPDGGFSHFTARLSQLVWLNILSLVCSLPVVTFGASNAALYTVLLHLLQGEDNCNVRKSGTCYIYRKPAKEREPEYIQETLDFAKMM